MKKDTILHQNTMVKLEGKNQNRYYTYTTVLKGLQYEDCQLVMTLTK